jgi:uncharacterized membrane-anchored protein
MTRVSNYWHEAATKVPEVTLGFWVIKIAATTLGETGGDSVTMTLNWGYLTGTAIFAAILIVFVALQIVSNKFRPFLYWATIVASTTFGTTMADFADRSLGIGYSGGSAILLGLVLGTLALWRWSAGSVSVQTIITPKAEAFYWATITLSQTLGTALGDWAADTGLGYAGGAVVFGAALAALAILYFRTDVSRVFLFWAAFILTRPLGATVGDVLDKPVHDGGLAFSRPVASAIIAAFIVLCILLLPQRPDRQSGSPLSERSSGWKYQARGRAVGQQASLLVGDASFGGADTAAAAQRDALRLDRARFGCDRPQQRNLEFECR